MHFGADRCTALHPCPCASSSLGLTHPSQGPSHPLRKSAYRSGWSMLVAMRAHSTRPLPSPECSGAVVTAPPAPPAAFPLVYSDFVWRQSMAVTTVVRDFDGGTLAVAVCARERNHGRAINRNHAPATTISIFPIEILRLQQTDSLPKFCVPTLVRRACHPGELPGRSM